MKLYIISGESSFKQGVPLHVHSVFWVKDAPDLATEGGRATAPYFIDQFVTTSVPSVAEDPSMHARVNCLQTHKHTDTCKRLLKGEEKCLFNFPQLISKFTMMKPDSEVLRSAKCYVIKREAGHEFINPYNPTLLCLWNANMDLQFFGSATGTAKYVCSYICKRESYKLRQTLTHVQQRIPGNAPIRSRLKTIGSTFLSHRQLSAQEAAYKMCGLPLRSSSVVVERADVCFVCLWD